MNSFVFYLGLAYLYYHLTGNRRHSLVALVVAIGIVLLVGFSRVDLGVHYPSDVLAGYIVGAWWLTIVLLLNKSMDLTAFLKGAAR